MGIVGHTDFSSGKPNYLIVSRRNILKKGSKVLVSFRKYTARNYITSKPRINQEKPSYLKPVRPRVWYKLLQPSRQLTVLGRKEPIYENIQVSEGMYTPADTMDRNTENIHEDTEEPVNEVSDGGEYHNLVGTEEDDLSSKSSLGRRTRGILKLKTAGRKVSRYCIMFPRDWRYRFE